MADDQNPQIPVTPLDQSASSDTNRPNSTIMADPSQSANIDDRPISTNLADPTNPTSDAPAVPIEPVSTISADFTAPSPQEQSANTDNQSEPTISADSPTTTVNPINSPTRIAPPEPVPEETSIPDQTATPLSPPPVPPILPTSPIIDSPSDVNNSPPINVSPPEIKPIGVQPEAPNIASTITQTQESTESASIKTEPLESPQNPPSADSDSAKSTSVTFGDLLSDNTNPPVSSAPVSLSPNLSDVSNPSDLPVSPSNNSSPTTNNPFTSPKPDVSGEGGLLSSSFGDLIKDTKQEESVMQPPPIPPTPPFISSSDPQPTTNNSQPVSQSSISPNLSVNRIKANQARVQRRNDHLNKIMELVKTKGKITNIDIRDSLRVSQSSATNYLSELVHRGSLKIEKHAKASFYTI